MGKTENSRECSSSLVFVGDQNHLIPSVCLAVACLSYRSWRTETIDDLVESRICSRMSGLIGEKTRVRGS